MIRINKNTLDAEMVRGNTGAFSVRPIIKGEYVLQEGDEVWFTVRKLKDEQIVIQKKITEFEIGENLSDKEQINPEDTESLELGNYIFDLVLNRADGTIDSLIPGGRDTAYFSLKRGVK